jgi:hypothetical protein
MTQPLDIEPRASATALLRCQPVTRADHGGFCALAQARLEHCGSGEMIAERPA